MRKRGRKSSAELSTVTISVEARRPSPPAELTDKQAQIWHDIVDTVPGGWFRPSEEPLLVAYCRHVVSAHSVSKKIDAFNFESGELKVLDRLLRMRERETRALSSLATRMRFTQQARMHPRTAGRAEDGLQGGRKLWERRPWDDD
jgi:hypothetical protein